MTPPPGNFFEEFAGGGHFSLARVSGAEGIIEADVHALTRRVGLEAAGAVPHWFGRPSPAGLNEKGGDQLFNHICSQRGGHS